VKRDTNAAPTGMPHRGGPSSRRGAVRAGHAASRSRRPARTRQSGLPCERCGAQCCRYLATEIDAPRSNRDLDDIRWYLLHRDVSVFIDAEGAWFLAFDTPCRELDAAGRCRRYADRPQLCRAHGQEKGSCEFFRPLHTVRFTTVAEFELWLASRRIDGRDRRRQRAHVPTHAPEATVGRRP